MPNAQKLDVCPYDCESEEGVMSNLDHTINKKIESMLKESEIWAPYHAWNFHGQVWWNREKNQWSCAVRRFRAHIKTINAETLKEIMEELSNEYGSE